MMYAQFEMLRFCYPKNRNGCQQRSPFPGTLGKICLHSRTSQSAPCPRSAGTLPQLHAAPTP